MSIYITPTARRSSAGTGPRETDRWQDRAVCAGIEITPNRDPFYAPAGESDDTQVWLLARQLCGACPVIDACLEAALAEESPNNVAGFRGGKTPEERRAIRRARMRPSRRRVPA